MRVAASILSVGVLCASVVALPAQQPRRQPRPSPAAPTTAPATAAARMPPIAEAQWTQQQRDLVLAYVRRPPATNDIRVLLNHPDLLHGVMPFWNYILYESRLPARDREILMLRTALVSRSAYIWGKYAAAATSPAIAAIAATDDTAAAVLDPFDAALLRTADSLHRASFVDDATWAVLAGRYGTEQLLDAVFTVAETSMLSMMTNSLAVPLDAAFSSPLPAAPRVEPSGAARRHPVLDVPRIPPLEPTFWTGELRVLLDPDATGRDVAAIYRTFARHTALYEPRQILSEYIRQKATLPAREREIAILRIGALCGSDYEWGAHVRAARMAGLTEVEIARLAAPGVRGWNGADAATVRAVDELYGGDVIGDGTWRELARHYDHRQLLDLLVTAGGYRMVSMALNTIGVPLEPGSERIPTP